MPKLLLPVFPGTVNAGKNERGIQFAFEQLGWDVHTVTLNDTPSDVHKNSDLLIEQMEAHDFDLLFVISEFFVHLQSLEFARQKQVPVFYWAFDDPFICWAESGPQLRDHFLAMMRQLDWIFCYDHHFLSKFEHFHVHKVSHLPLAANTQFFDNDCPGQANYEYDAVFLGIYNPYRAQMLSEVSPAQLSLWGPNWSPQNSAHSSNGLASQIQSAEIYRKSKMAINMHHPQSVYASNLRTFEIMACACLCLVEPMQELQEMFVDGRDLVFYQDRFELSEKISYYLAHPQEVQAIALSGHQAVHSKHSYVQRMSDVLTVWQQRFALT